MHDEWDLVIIGGGASGMAAAIVAARLGDRVLLLEKSSALGRKVSASGNGRCNLMNTGNPVYFGNPSFAHQVLGYFSAEDLWDFWNNAGLFLIKDDAERVYPRTLQSSTVLETLKMHLRICQVKILLQAAVSVVRKDNVKYR